MVTPDLLKGTYIRAMHQQSSMDAYGGPATPRGNKGHRQNSGTMLDAKCWAVME